MPILALGIPISDTLLAIIRRAFRGAPLFSADRSRLHRDTEIAVELLCAHATQALVRLEGRPRAGERLRRVVAGG